MQFLPICNTGAVVVIAVSLSLQYLFGRSNCSFSLCNIGAVVAIAVSPNLQYWSGRSNCSFSLSLCNTAAVVVIAVSHTGAVVVIAVSLFLQYWSCLYHKPKVGRCRYRMNRSKCRDLKLEDGTKTDPKLEDAVAASTVLQPSNFPAATVKTDIRVHTGSDRSHADRGCMC